MDEFTMPMNDTLFNINKLVRKNILNMKPYSSARDEFSGAAEVYLDANENPYKTNVNRYPDPHQVELKKAIGELKGISPDLIILGNGSDEPIDLLIRSFCEPTIDSVLLLEPTYGMYSVCADVNAVDVQRVQLSVNFDIDWELVRRSIDTSTKIIFLCSPNNPSGNLLSENKIDQLLNYFNGLVVIDEAYIDFAESNSYLQKLSKYPNLVVLQTFSKAWGLAALRLGACYASKEIIAVLNKVKYPYNINILTQQLALEAIQAVEIKNNWVTEIINSRKELALQLSSITIVEHIYPSDANFLLIKVKDANHTYTSLLKQGIIVRDRSKIPGCENCIRITVGTEYENKKLIEALKKL